MIKQAFNLAIEAKQTISKDEQFKAKLFHLAINRGKANCNAKHCALSILPCPMILYPMPFPGLNIGTLYHDTI